MNPGLYLDAILLKSSRDFVKNSRKIVKELEAKSQILTDLLDGDPDINEMKSSEEMRSKFDDYNKNEVKKRAVVTSMDAKSLYPSIKKSVAREAIIELLDICDLEIKNIDYWDAQKYIAILCSPVEIKEAGLAAPRPPGTINCLFTKEDNEKWVPG